MKRWLIAAAVLVGIVVAAFLTVRAIQSKRQAAEEAQVTETAVSVKVTPVRRGHIERSFTVTGTV